MIVNFDELENVLSSQSGWECDFEYPYNLKELPDQSSVFFENQYVQRELEMESLAAKLNDMNEMNSYLQKKLDTNTDEMKAQSALIQQLESEDQQTKQEIALVKSTIEQKIMILDDLNRQVNKLNEDKNYLMATIEKKDFLIIIKEKKI